MTVIRVLVGKGHKLVRAGLRALLESLAGVAVVAEASHGREALNLVSAIRAGLVHPG